MMSVSEPMYCYYATNSSSFPIHAHAPAEIEPKEVFYFDWCPSNEQGGHELVAENMDGVEYIYQTEDLEAHPRIDTQPAIQHTAPYQESFPSISSYNHPVVIDIPPSSPSEENTHSRHPTEHFIVPISTERLCAFVKGPMPASELTLNVHNIGVSSSFFCCDFLNCPDKFQSHSFENVIYHVHSTHFKEKKFFCGVCYTSFARRHDAARHVRTRNGGRKYGCGICAKVFARKDYRDVHVTKCLKSNSLAIANSTRRFGLGEVPPAAMNARLYGYQ